MYLPLQIAHKARSAGFTMIELLVVIAVIGVLAVAVLSSINPIEQINKGRDTRTRSDAAQLINATDRFFAVHEIYPWNDATYNTPALSADEVYTVLLPNGTNCAAEANGMCLIQSTSTWLDGLSDTAEVKPGYINRIRGMVAPSQLYVYKAAVANATMYVCFQPTSLAIQTEALDNCVDDRQTGGPGVLPAGACPVGGVGSYNASTPYTAELLCLP